MTMKKVHIRGEHANASHGAAGAPGRVVRSFGIAPVPLSDPEPIPQSRPVSLQTGAFVFVQKEASMFEGQSRSELEEVFQANPEFRRLYHHHKELDKKVMDAELGVLPIDDNTLARMKREKLAAKDRLTRMYDSLAASH